PSLFHIVWPIVSISLLAIFLSKGVAEYLGTTQIQYVGHAATTDLRNRVFTKILRQPIGFFQHHPTGRLLSTAINDIEKTRIALSEYLADLFQKEFTLIVYLMFIVHFN